MRIRVLMKEYSISLLVRHKFTLHIPVAMYLLLQLTRPVCKNMKRYNYISRESYTTRNVLWSLTSVCLSVRGRMPTLLHKAGCNLEGSGGMPLVVHCWADLQLVHGLRCYGNTMERQSPAVIHQTHCTPHAVPRTMHAGEDWLPSPAIKSTRLLRAPYSFVHTAGV